MSRLSHSERLEAALAYLGGDSPASVGRRFGTSGRHVIMIAKRYLAAKEKAAAAPKREIKRLNAPAITSRAGRDVRPEQTGSGMRRSGGYLRLM
jgi:hypothetical protein